MAGLTVSGLGSSGIDVNSVVNQLMAIERAPQDSLSAKKTAVLTRGTTWSSVTTQLTSLQAAVEAVKTPASFNSAGATSSDSSVLTATAGGTAAPSSVTLQVQSLAAAQQRASAGFASTSSVVGAGTFLVSGGASAAGITAMTASGLADGRHTLTVKDGGTNGGPATLVLDGAEHIVTLGSGPVSFGGLTLDASTLKTGAVVDLTVASTDASTTLAGLASTIAGYGGPASAAAVDLGSGNDPARLVLSAAKAGTANALLVSGTGDLATLASGMTTTKPASDAVVSMGSLTVTRASNTITDLIPGVTLNLQKAAPGTDVQLSVSRDVAGSSAKVKTLVDSLNASLDLLAKSTAYDSVNKRTSPLTGDSSVRSLMSDLSGLGSLISSGTTSTMSQLGINITREGRYTFDATAFGKQMAADPDGVANLMSKAGEAVGKVLDSALGKVGQRGWIKTTQEAITNQAADLQKSIDDWDDRLTAMQSRYQLQYAQLDAAISSLNTQRTWLSSTIDGLKANSASS
jgi:flagellar hook-associated protein 2